MKKLLLVLVICTSGLFASAVARAQDPISLSHNGVPGVWLGSETAKRVLRDVEEVHSLRVAIELCDDSRALRQQRIDRLTAALKLANEASNTSKAALDEAIRGRREAEEDADRWFSGSHLTWHLVGVALGAVGGLVLYGHR